MNFEKPEKKGKKIIVARNVLKVVTKKANENINIFTTFNISRWNAAKYIAWPTFSRYVLGFINFCVNINKIS